MCSCLFKHAEGAVVLANPCPCLKIASVSSLVHDGVLYHITYVLGQTSFLGTPRSLCVLYGSRLCAGGSYGHVQEHAFMLMCITRSGMCAFLCFTRNTFFASFTGCALQPSWCVLFRGSVRLYLLAANLCLDAISVL